MWTNLTLALSGGTSSLTGVGASGSVSATATASPSGGSGSYSYSWSRASGDSGISINSTTSASPTFSAVCQSGVPRTATWRCTVTSGGVSVSETVTITLTFFSRDTDPV
ncbi:PKD domain-containing protein [Coralloluteibacterium stylophorae]|uniref:PKD domain-containing protein n=1 Tax=Coralloluteibacterium stylophorae TaxID=1776034 RepID=UPI003CCDF548